MPVDCKMLDAGCWMLDAGIRDTGYGRFKGQYLNISISQYLTFYLTSESGTLIPAALASLASFADSAKDFIL